MPGASLLPGRFCGEKAGVVFKIETVGRKDAVFLAVAGGGGLLYYQFGENIGRKVIFFFHRRDAKDAGPASRGVATREDSPLRSRLD